VFYHVSRTLIAEHATVATACSSAERLREGDDGNRVQGGV